MTAEQQMKCAYVSVCVSAQNGAAVDPGLWVMVARAFTRACNWGRDLQGPKLSRAPLEI